MEDQGDAGEAENNEQEVGGGTPADNSDELEISITEDVCVC